MTAESKHTPLTATYASPNNQHFTITKALHAPPSASPQDRTTYLAALRKAVTDTQDQINKELTVRMDRDKALGSTAGQDVALGADEDREEENYGEEVQGQD